MWILWFCAVVQNTLNHQLSWERVYFNIGNSIDCPMKFIGVSICLNAFLSVFHCSTCTWSLELSMTSTQPPTHHYALFAMVRGRDSDRGEQGGKQANSNNWPLQINSRSRRDYVCVANHFYLIFMPSEQSGSPKTKEYPLYRRIAVRPFILKQGKFFAVNFPKQNLIFPEGRAPRKKANMRDPISDPK